MRVEFEPDERRARIEIIPLLDVLLIVLIFFVYLAVSMTAQKAMNVELPTGKGQPIGNSVTVTIDRDSRITLNGRNVANDPAEAILAEARRRGIDPPRVVLRSDRRSNLGTSIELISRLHEAGVADVSIEMMER